MTQLNKELDLQVRPKLFLIHGWNMPPLIWNPLVEKLRQHFDVHVATLPGYRQTIEDVGEPRDQQMSVENALSSLLEQAPERSHWCGWSLGATLAMQAAIAEPGRISKLTLISPTARFFQTDDWPHGASVSVFDRLLQITLKKYPSWIETFFANATYWQRPHKSCQSVGQGHQRQSAQRPRSAVRVRDIERHRSSRSPNTNSNANSSHRRRVRQRHFTSGKSVLCGADSKRDFSKGW